MQRNGRPRQSEATFDPPCRSKTTSCCHQLLRGATNNAGEATILEIEYPRDNAVTRDLRPWSSSRLFDRRWHVEPLIIGRFQRSPGTRLAIFPRSTFQLLAKRFISRRGGSGSRGATARETVAEARFGGRRAFAIRMRVIAGVDSGPPERKRQLRLLRKR